MRTAAVIPTLNEEKAILDVIEGSWKHADSVIVSDHSTDRTPELVREQGKAILIDATMRGKGAQLREGFSRALEEGAKLIIQIDGDGERDPADIGRMKDAIRKERTDLAVARRDTMRSSRRRLLNAFGFLWIRLTTGCRIRDPFSGMIAFRSTALRKLGLKSRGFEIEPEIILESWKHGLSMSEVAVKVPDMSSSRFSIRDMLETNLFFDSWVIRNKGRVSPLRRLVLPFCFLGLASAIPLWISRH